MTMESLISDWALMLGLSETLIMVIFTVGGGLLWMGIGLRLFWLISSSVEKRAKAEKLDTVRTVKTVYDEKGKFISESKRGYRKYEPKV